MASQEIRHKAIKLPTFNGYTIDYRIREFRRFIYGELPEFIPFDSDRGKELLSEMEENNNAV